jgi:hypothetical protein
MEWSEDSQSCQRGKYGHEFHGTRSQGTLCWRGPVGTPGQRPVDSRSQYPPHVKEKVLFRNICKSWKKQKYSDCRAVVYYLIRCRPLSCCTPWGGSLGCANHPGKLYAHKGAVWTGGCPSRRGFRVRSRILSSDIPIGNVSGSPVAGVLENRLVVRRFPYCLRLFTLFTYSFGVELRYIISYLCAL